MMDGLPSNCHCCELSDPNPYHENARESYLNCSLNHRWQLLSRGVHSASSYPRGSLTIPRCSEDIWTCHRIYTVPGGRLCGPIALIMSMAPTTPPSTRIAPYCPATLRQMVAYADQAPLRGGAPSLDCACCCFRLVLRSGGTL